MFKLKDSIQKFFGYLLLAFGIMLFFVGIGMLFDPEGIPVKWQGTMKTAPSAPKDNWAYYNSTKDEAFIWKKGVWQTLHRADNESDDAVPIMIVSNIFILPGILLVFLGIRSAREEKLLMSSVGIVKSYRRISIEEIARKLQISYIKAEEIITAAINLNLIQGNFDRTTGEFYTEESRDQKIEFRYCPSCGSPLEKVYLEGDTIKCDACGTIMA